MAPCQPLLTVPRAVVLDSELVCGHSRSKMSVLPALTHGGGGAAGQSTGGLVRTLTAGRLDQVRQVQRA